MELPDDPITMMMESASQLHEMFLAFVDAGFDEDQSLRLIIGLVQAAMRNE